MTNLVLGHWAAIAMMWLLMSVAPGPALVWAISAA
jgi:hypothetical protein